jgi:hypothetical protein
VHQGDVSAQRIGLSADLDRTLKINPAALSIESILFRVAGASSIFSSAVRISPLLSIRRQQLALSRKVDHPHGDVRVVGPVSVACLVCTRTADKI